MQRSLLVFGVLFGFLVLQPGSSRGQTLTPVGAWQVSITGSDPGTTMMTFSNDFSVSGYGISQKQFGLYTLTGNWGFDSQGDVVVAYVQALGGTNTALSFTAKLSHSGRFTGKGTGTSGHFRFKGETATDFPDLSGSWVATGKRRGKIFHETYQIVASTNFPAVFDATGQGLDDTGSFTLTGEFIANSHNQLNASIDRTFAGPDTVDSSLWGTIKPKKSQMTLRGTEDTGVMLSIKAVE